MFHGVVTEDNYAVDLSRLLRRPARYVYILCLESAKISVEVGDEQVNLELNEYDEIEMESDKGISKIVVYSGRIEVFAE